MKNISTGTGIALLAGAIVAYPIIDRVMPRAEAGATHVAAVVAAAPAQVPPEPTIVWYGVSPQTDSQSTATMGALIRAWSDGRIEYRAFRTNSPYSSNPCDVYQGGATACGWRLLADPAEGLTYRSDIDFNSKVDGSDLAQVLNDWGNAPRQDIVPSTCPLNLINP